jgi:DNA (cytosine-5)-methyltransferase 1
MTFKFIDLFAGIGGFHLAFHRLGAECVFASEIDKHARATYTKNFHDISPKIFDNNLYNDDILKIEDPSSQIPDFDILCAGFPCQPFSQAGYKRGFKETAEDRGNMFFNICKIIQAKRPKAFFLENVRHLINHNEGETFRIIRNYLEEILGYSFNFKIIKASDYGLPQHRPRVYMVGFRKDNNFFMPEFSFPRPILRNISMSDVLGGRCDRDIGFTLRVGGKGSGVNDRRNWDSYIVDGVERVLTPNEGKIMMGFPPEFEFPVSTTQAMKQLGNSVAVNAIQATANQILLYLKAHKSLWEQKDSKAKDVRIKVSG